MKKNGAFGARLYSMFTKSVLIPALIAIFCFGVYSNYTVNEREEQNIEDILSSVSQNLEIQFQDIQNIEKAFYIYSEVYREAEALNNPALYGNYDELSLQELENSYSLTLTKLIHTSNQDVRAVVFFPVSGEDEAYCLGKDEGQLKSIEYPGYKEEPWYQKAVDQVEAPVFCGMHIPEYQTNKKLGEVYSYVRAVRNMDNRKVMGVIKIDVRGEFLVQTLSAIEQTDDSGLLILNNGEYFSSSRWLGALGGESLEVSGEGQIRWGNRQYRSTEREISGTGLTLAYLDSGSFLYQGLVPVMIVSILILLSGIAVGTLCERLRVPALFAISLGLLFGATGVLDEALLAITSEIRRAALVVILLRAGLSTRFSELKKSGSAAVLLCFLPALAEMCAVGLIAPLLFPLDGTEAFLLGSVLAAGTLSALWNGLGHERAVALHQPCGALAGRTAQHGRDEVHGEGTRLLRARLSAQGDGAGGDRRDPARGGARLRGNGAFRRGRVHPPHRAARRGGDRMGRKTPSCSRTGSDAGVGS